MVKKTDIQLFASAVFLIIFFQLATSFFFANNYIGLIGTIHYLFLGSFILFLFIASKTPVNQVYLLILIYHLILVGVLYQFFLFEYNNPLGYNPKDAAYYHKLALTLKKLNFQDSVSYSFNTLDLSDFGYPFVLQNIYRISGSNPLIVAKFFSILFHIATCFYLVKISDYLFANSSLSKTLLILYGLNPSSIFFITSGLKEPLFALVVVLAFYLSLKAYIFNSKLNLLFAIVTVLITGLFRTAYPVFIILSLVTYAFWNFEGKHRRFKQISLLTLGIIAFLGTYVFFKNDLLQKINYNFSAIVEYRLGYVPGKLEYFVMMIGGIVGPFPSFNYSEYNQLGLLQTIGNFVKIILSFFFLIGTYLIIKNKNRKMYVGLIFIMLNISVLVLLAASLDYRFLYPFMPLYFLIVAFGYKNYNKKKLPLILNAPVYLFSITILMILYNFR